MERIPEPELMDDDEQARAYSEANFAEPHERFVQLFLAAFPGLMLDGTVLDLGCGPADVTVRFARAYREAKVHGIDGAAAMLALGRARLDAERLGDRVQLFRARLPYDAPPLPAYDAVVSNSLLHHLADPGVLWSAVVRYARPGAPVFVMDLVRPTTANDVERLVEENASDEPDILKRDFRASLHAAFTLDEVRAQLVDAGLGHLVVEAVTDRHLLVRGRR